MFGSVVEVTKEEDPELERKARRAMAILYAVTIAGIVVPIALWWWLGR